MINKVSNPYSLPATVTSSFNPFVGVITKPTEDFAFVALPTLIEATFSVGSPTSVAANVDSSPVGDMAEAPPGVWSYEWTPSAVDSNAEITATSSTYTTGSKSVEVKSADQQVTLGNGVGDPMSVPSDVGGNAATAPSSPASPTLSSDDPDFAGEDVLVFSGAQYLEWGNATSQEYVFDGTGGTFFVVFHTDHTGGLTYIYGQRLGGNGRGIQIGHTNGQIDIVLANGVAQIATPSFAAAVDTTHVLVWRLDGSNYAVWLDDPDTPVASGVCSSAPTIGPAAGVPTIGARSTGTSPFVGKIAIAGALDEALSDAAVAALMGSAS